MPEEVVHFITVYGYYAIFIMVFLQEIGMPNPLPNELLLAFSGYMAFKGMLSFPLILITALSADFTGTTILYFIFYKAGGFIIKKRPGWISGFPGILKKLKSTITDGNQYKIFFFRLTPYIRGYTSVITGLLQVRPVVFLPVALASAMTWATVFITAGYIIGPSWDSFVENFRKHNYLLIGMLTLITIFLLILSFARKKIKNTDVKGLQSLSESEKIRKQFLNT